MNKEQILANAKKLQTTCGIYFLILEERIVYIGQSVNIEVRVHSHIKSGKRFDSYSVIECEEKDLFKLEAEFIHKFRPENNQYFPLDPKPSKEKFIKNILRRAF